MQGLTAETMKVSQKQLRACSKNSKSWGLLCRVAWCQEKFGVFLRTRKAEPLTSTTYKFLEMTVLLLTVKGREARVEFLSYAYTEAGRAITMMNIGFYIS